MKIENLIGINEVKDFKTLCEIIEVRCVGGKSKQLLERKIRRFINYEKIPNSHRIRIIEIYATPLPKYDIRTEGNNSKYLKHMEVVFRYKLQNHQAINKTVTELGIELGFISRKHSYYNKKRRQFFDNHVIVKNFLWIPEMLYERIDTQYRSIIKTALDNMKRRGIIEINKVNYAKRINEKFPKPISEQDAKTLAEIKIEVEHKMKGSCEEIFYKEIKPRTYNMLKKGKILQLIKQRLNISYQYDLLSINLLDKKSIVTEEEYRKNCAELKEKYRERCLYIIDKAMDEILKNNSWALDEAYKIKNFFIKDLFEV